MLSNVDKLFNTLRDNQAGAPTSLYIKAIPGVL